MKFFPIRPVLMVSFTLGIGTYSLLNPNNVTQAQTIAGQANQQQVKTVLENNKIFYLEKSTAPIPKMVIIPAGSFLMGQPNGSAFEKPMRKVTINYSFAMSQTEITIAQYDAYVQNKKHDISADVWRGQDSQPVVNVSWNDVQGYLQWVNEITKKEYRLPSEAEWEYAARAGAVTAYHWGDKIGHNNANCLDCGSRWDNKKTAPVGSFKGNAFGLFDMHGNAREWVQDCYSKNFAALPVDGSAYEQKQCLD